MKSTENTHTIQHVNDLNSRTSEQNHEKKGMTMTDMQSRVKSEMTYDAALANAAKHALEICNTRE